jgi:hypothetical protein
MREEHKLRMIENSGLKWTFGFEMEEVTADSRKLKISSYIIYNPHQIIY